VAGALLLTPGFGLVVLMNHYANTTTGVMWYAAPVRTACSIGVLFGPALSLGLAAGTAASAASKLAFARKSGAADNLLLAPAALDCLGWAAVRAQSRRGIRALVCVLPFHAIALVEFMRENRYGFSTAPAATLALLVVLAALAELGMIQRAASLGSWIGAAGRSPTAAVVAGAVGGLLLWVLRPAVAIGFLAAQGVFRSTWDLVWLCCLAELLCFVLVAAPCMRLARRALAVPACGEPEPFLARLGLTGPWSRAWEPPVERRPSAILSGPGLTLLVGGALGVAVLGAGRPDVAAVCQVLTWFVTAALLDARELDPCGPPEALFAPAPSRVVAGREIAS
jgi:hypothetical protein